MKFEVSHSQIALAVIALIGATAAVTTPTLSVAAGKTPGKYAAGDFHNHTTCSDGAMSMQKLVKKATDRTDTPWGLDWFVQAGHGGSGNRNCTLAEDTSLATPAYPLVFNATTANLQGPTTTWQNTNPPKTVKGQVSGTPPSQNMWRWQSLQEFQYPLLEYLAAFKDKPMFLGVESVVAGHEHSSMSVITGQMPNSIYTTALPTTSGYQALGNAAGLAQWEYCFDRNDTDRSRGNTTLASGIGNNWNCSVTGSLNATDPSWSVDAQKLIPAGGAGTGNRGHLKTVEAVKWMKEKHGQGSYYVPAHLERAGPFNPDGNNGFNIEHLRNFNNAGPEIAFGFETQPGHGASENRGEYAIRRNNIAGVPTDSVGGTTYGGTGVYGSQIGGVWDALLGEGRNFWFFASSDWHSRGAFSVDDRRTDNDFYPGEYQRNYTMVRNGNNRLNPQTIVDGLRSGNNWAASGQLIDRMAFIACASYPGIGARTNVAVENLALNAAIGNTDIDVAGCVTMGEKLKVRPGADIVVAVVVRDPAGKNYSPYAFFNPSLLQVGIQQMINQPKLDHIDLIRGMVTGYKTPGTPDYSGEWPRNTNWLRADGTTAGLSAVPNGAKNTTAGILKTFNGAGTNPWTTATSSADGTAFLKMSYRIPAVTASQYVRLRGTNLPPSVPYETDADGNPLSDMFTNSSALANLRIPCTSVQTVVIPTGTYNGTPEIDGCPAHLPSTTIAASGNKAAYTGKVVAVDIAAWSDLWFYSNPLFVEVSGSTVVAGVK
jgi:hypothetical protein